MTSNILAVGHNEPPPDIDPLLERLQETHADIAARAQYLLEAEARVPTVVTEENKGKITDYARQIDACRKKVDEAHKAEKEPFLTSCRTVDGWKNALVAPLAEVRKRIQAKLDAYVAEADRRERERLKAEADRLAAEAKTMQKAGDREGAQQASTEAASLQAAAKAASAADLVRSHTGLGGVLTAKSPIDYEITDKKAAVCALWRDIDDEALEKAIRQYTRDGKQSLRTAIEAGEQPVAGVRLFITRKAQVR